MCVIIDNNVFPCLHPIPGELCEADLAALGDWTMRMKISKEKELAEEGWRELEQIGNN